MRALQLFGIALLAYLTASTVLSVKTSDDVIIGLFGGPVLGIFGLYFFPIAWFIIIAMWYARPRLGHRWYRHILHGLLYFGGFSLVNTWIFVLMGPKVESQEALWSTAYATAATTGIIVAGILILMLQTYLEDKKAENSAD